MNIRFAIKFNSNGKTYFNTLPFADNANNATIMAAIADLEQMTTPVDEQDPNDFGGRVVGVSQAVVDIRVKNDVIEPLDITDSNSKIYTGRMTRTANVGGVDLEYTTPFLLKGLDVNFTEPASLVIPPPGGLDEAVTAFLKKYGWVGDAVASGVVLVKRANLH